jgi:hypothetical protein
MKLTTPPEKSAVENAIEMCELMIEEGIADILSRRETGSARKPSHLGADFDEGYAQGKKDACRVILISLGVPQLGATTDKAKHG